MSAIGFVKVKLQDYQSFDCEYKLSKRAIWW